jgi:hypothetical protein
MLDPTGVDVGWELQMLQIGVVLVGRCVNFQTFSQDPCPLSIALPRLPNDTLAETLPCPAVLSLETPSVRLSMSMSVLPLSAPFSPLSVMCA